MSLEELWELFPVVLVAHDVRWRDWAEEEIGLLTDLLAGFGPRISHIGSTAVEGIFAKPIVDILVEVVAGVDWAVIKKIMITNGYICMSESEGRMSFNKGYTPVGYAERVFHIHFHRMGDSDELLFRDYLVAHPEIAKEYERLKMSLLPKYRNDRDGYTDAKSEFVERVVALARLGAEQQKNFG